MIKTISHTDSKIFLNINREFLSHNTEISEYISEYERSICEALRELDQGTRDHFEVGQGHKRASDKTQVQIWFNNSIDKELIRVEPQSDKKNIHQKLKNGMLNHAIDLLNKRSPNTDIRVIKFKNLDERLKACIEKC